MPAGRCPPCRPRCVELRLRVTGFAPGGRRIAASCWMPWRLPSPRPSPTRSSTPTPAHPSPATCGCAAGVDGSDSWWRSPTTVSGSHTATTRPGSAGGSRWWERFAEALDVAHGPGGSGTAVTMTFAAPPATERAAPGLAAAVQRWRSTPSPMPRASTSCATASCAARPQRSRAMPACPRGCATRPRPRSPARRPGRRCARAAPHLVVHDPTVPARRAASARSSACRGGSPSRSRAPTARPRPCGASAAGSADVPAPSPARLDTLVDAARGDLGDEAQRATLRARLGAPR